MFEGSTPDSEKDSSMALVNQENENALAKSDKKDFKEWKREKHRWTISGTTLLREAAQESNAPVTRHLLSQGYGEKVLKSAIVNDEVTVVQSLIVAGYDLKQRIGLRTPLTMAVLKNRFSIVKMLIEQGANPDERDAYQETPMVCALNANNIEMVKILIEGGVDLEQHTMDGKYRTPLLRAVYREKTLMVKTLLEGGAKVNIQDKEGRTPLEQAVYDGTEGIAKLLIEAGADLDMKGTKERTAMEWAQEWDHHKMIALLEEAAGKQNPAKVQKSTDQWTVVDKKDSKMAIHVQYDAASQTRMKDIFNFRTGILLMEVKSGDEIASLEKSYFKDGAVPDNYERLSVWSCERVV